MRDVECNRYAKISILSKILSNALVISKITVQAIVGGTIVSIVSLGIIWQTGLDKIPGFQGKLVKIAISIVCLLSLLGLQKFARTWIKRFSDKGNCEK